MVAVGETERLPFEPLPVPTNVPPQLPEYHFQEAQEPNVPPLTVNIDVPPTAILAGLAVAEVGLVELLQDDVTVTVTDAHAVVLPPSALTKYVVVAVGETERLPFVPVPVPTNVPPQLPEYHFHDPQEPNVPPLTVNVDVPPTVILAGLAVAEVGLVELEQDDVTVTVTDAQVVVFPPSALTK